LLNKYSLGSYSNRIAEIPLVNRAEKLDADHVKSIGTLRRVKALDDACKQVRVNLTLVANVPEDDG